MLKIKKIPLLARRQTSEEGLYYERVKNPEISRSKTENYMHNCA